MKGEKIYHIEDSIKLPVSPVELNPKEVYKVLDKDKRKYSEKYNNLKLFPSCYGGLLSCEYYMKLIIEMDSWFSSDEEIFIPLDFYEPFNVIFDKKQTFINNNIPQNNSYINNHMNFKQINKNIDNSKFNNQSKTQSKTVNNDYENNELPSQEVIKNITKENQKEHEDDDGSAPPPSF